MRTPSMSLKVLSLFSGGGLGDLGLMAAGMEIVGQVEIDAYCQKVLALRYPETAKWTDIRSVTGEQVKERCGPVDVISGGFPCQPFSNAGKQRGSKDDRHLWPEMLRVISEVRPAWVIGENVSGFINMALDDVLADLEAAGYEATTFVFPAHALGAWHRRERVWIVANANAMRFVKRSDKSREERQKVGGREFTIGSQTLDVADPADTRIEDLRERQDATVADVPDAISQRGCGREGDGQDAEDAWESSSGAWRRFWNVEPNVGRVANGVAARVHRLKCLGNGQVPACTAFIGERIIEFENQQRRAS